MRRKRYFPGCLYGMIFLTLLSLAAVFIMVYVIGTENLTMESEGFLIAILIIFLLIMAASFIGGILLFKFTEKKIRQKLEKKYEEEYGAYREEFGQKLEKDAHDKAEKKELIIGITFIVIVTPILVIINS